MKPQNRRAKSSLRDGGQLILLNKPFGYVSQFSGSDRNLSDLVKISNVYPAGRLDKDSEGLLLLTDNGALQHKIAHPTQKLNKTYCVQVEGTASDDVLQQLRNGVMLKDGMAKVVKVSKTRQPAELWARIPPVRHRQSIPTDWLKIVINEGRNRQIRRMTAAVNLPTLRLIRSNIGGWTINGIQCGKYETIRFDSAEELLK